MNQLIRESSMQNRSINTVQGRAFTTPLLERKVLDASLSLVPVTFQPRETRRILLYCPVPLSLAEKKSIVTVARTKNIFSAESPHASFAIALGAHRGYKFRFMPKGLFLDRWKKKVHSFFLYFRRFCAFPIGPFFGG